MKQTKFQKAIECEVLRKRLVGEGKFDEACQTYSTQKEFFPDENTGKFWDEHFEREDEVFPMEEWRIQQVIAELDCQKSILNLGVGRGVLEKKLLEKCTPVQYLGTDITQSTLTRLKKKFPNLEFKKTDLLGLNSKKYQFDQVLLLEVLEHIKPNETFQVLEHIYSLVKKNGTFLVSVPVNEGLEEMLPKNPNSHMRLYSEELLAFELEHVGFQIEKVFRASAFATNFAVKHFLNTFFQFREPNNFIFFCRKK